MIRKPYGILALPLTPAAGEMVAKVSKLEVSC